MLRRPRRSEPSKAICAVSLREMPSLRRGRRPHHVRKGTRRNLRDLMSGHRLPSNGRPYRNHLLAKIILLSHDVGDGPRADRFFTCLHGCGSKTSFLVLSDTLLNCSTVPHAYASSPFT